MSTAQQGRRVAVLLAVALALLGSALPAHAYIRVSYSLGRIASESKCITVARVTEVDRSKNVITYRKVRDIRGSYPAETIRHNIGKNGEFSGQGKGAHGKYIGESARDWRDVMEWANVGKEVVFFWNGGPCEVCIGNYWYQVVPEGSDWRLLHSEPTFALAFAGRVPNLIAAATAMVAGQEVVVPAMVPSEVNALLERTARPHRLKASLKLTDYNPQRDFVGWGGDGDDLRPVAGMPGFSHYGALTTLRGGTTGLAPACFQGEDKPGLCLFNEQRVVLMEQREGFLAEIALPVEGGARAAAWADGNGDGRPDLLLATPAGLNLLMNMGSNKFVSCTNRLPLVPYQHVTAATWIRTAPEAPPDILLADGFRGLRLYRNRTAVPSAAAAGAVTNVLPLFEDVSEAVGLGVEGAAGALPCAHLVVADLNGDGSDDLLVGAGSGVVLLQTKQGFQAVAAAGIAYRPQGVRPAFGDFNGDGRPDLFAPQADGPSRLFLNIGAGRFRDVTALAGDLAKPLGTATCAVWSDFCKRGRADLLVGCLRGQNRYFRNQGNGTFTDAGRELGLYDAIYNSTDLSVQDINQDGVPDLVMGNTGGESAVLLGSRERLTAASPEPVQAAAGKNQVAGKGEVAHASTAR